MLTNKNLVTLSGGLTKDAEVFDTAGVVHLSLAVDSSGSEKSVQNATGYFDVKVWLTASKYSAQATADNVKNLITEGMLIKGTRVSVVGRLVQERWKDKEGNRMARVVVMAESIDAYRTGSKTSESTGATADAATTASSVINEF